MQHSVTHSTLFVRLVMYSIVRTWHDKRVIHIDVGHQVFKFDVIDVIRQLFLFAMNSVPMETTETTL